MKVITTIIMLLIYPNLCWSLDCWTKNEIGLQTLSTSLQIIDWGQTLNIVDRENEGYWETNPILGDHPDRGEVNTYFAVSILTNILISHLLPNKWRKVWIGSRIMVSANLVNHNYNIGLKIKF